MSTLSFYHYQYLLSIFLKTGITSVSSNFTSDNLVGARSWRDVMRLFIIFIAQTTNTKWISKSTFRWKSVNNDQPPQTRSDRNTGPRDTSYFRTINFFLILLRQCLKQTVHRLDHHCVMCWKQPHQEVRISSSRIHPCCENLTILTGNKQTSLIHLAYPKYPAFITKDKLPWIWWTPSKSKCSVNTSSINPQSELSRVLKSKQLIAQSWNLRDRKFLSLKIQGQGFNSANIWESQKWMNHPASYNTIKFD